MKHNEHEMVRTWVDIDTRALRANYRLLRGTIAPGVKMMGVVKSNAYGHNLTEFALELEKCGIDALAVDSIIEALSLRRVGAMKTILVLGYTLPLMMESAVGKNIHLTISSIPSLRALLKIPRANKIPIHLKVDTGMHRQGFLLSEMNEVLTTLLEVGKKINVAGLYTHFAEAKDPTNRASTQKQITEFLLWKKTLQAVGFSPIVHAGATGGSLAFPDAHFDMVRMGAGMYGIWPSPETKKAFSKKFPLKPVLCWKTIISEVKVIPAGDKIGYDLTHTAKSKMRIAVCPIGYWHGYPRALSNNADVLVRGHRAPVVGRVSMDMIVIDITGIPQVKEGDEVVLIGRSGKFEITADELATLAGTTAYEMLTRLNPLMKRIYR